MTCSVISTINPPSVVHQSIKCNFTSATVLNLILVKTNIIEFYNLLVNGIFPLFKVNLFGRVISLDKYKPKDTDLDQLILLTDKNHLITLQFNPQTHQINTISKLNLFNPYGKLNQSKSFCIINQKHKACLTSIYQGDFGIIWFDGGGSDSGGNGGSGKFKGNSGKSNASTSNNDNNLVFLSGQISHRQRLTVEQFEILDICFLNQTKYLSIALLYSDYSGSLFVKFYQVTKLSSKLTEVYGEREIDQKCQKLVALPNGGLLLLGGNKLILWNSDKYSVNDQLSINLTESQEFTNFEVIDNTRILVGNNLGKLYLIKLTLAGTIGQYKSIELHLIGYTSIPQSITYLNNRFLFIGSGSGDSQIWKLPYKLDSFKLYQSLNNLGPITDLKYLKLNQNNNNDTDIDSSDNNNNLDGNTPASLILSSGIGLNGSIKKLSIGFSWLIKLKLELGAIMKIYSFSKLKLIGLEFVNYIKLLKWDEISQELEVLNDIEVDNNGSDNNTLLMFETNEEQIIHVTGSKILIYNYTDNSLNKEYEWENSDNSKILLSSGYGDKLAIMNDSNTLHYFKITNSSLTLISQHKFDKSITFIELIPDYSEFNNLCILSNSTQTTITLFNLKKLSLVDTVGLPDLGSYSSLLTSIKVIEFGGGGKKYLFIGLSGGGCLYSRVTNKKLFELEFRELGVGPIHLLKSQASSDNEDEIKKYLVTTGDKPHLIHYNLDKIIFSPIYSNETTYLSLFPNSNNNWIIFCNDEGLEIGEISQNSNIQVNSFELGKQPRKVILIPNINKLALLTHRENNSSLGCIQLLDPNTFDSDSEYVFNPNELTSCLDWITINNDKDQNYLVIGTGLLKLEEEECHSGNILFFKINPEKEYSIKLVLSIPVKGAVYDLLYYNKKLIVGVNGMLNLFNINSIEKGDYKLLHTLYMPTTITQLDLIDDYIIAQDFIRSIQLITLNKDNDQLIHYCGDNTPTWPISSRALDNTTILSSDSNFNLILLKRYQSALGRGEKPKLNWFGQIYWGDQINCICRKPNDNKTLVFGTSGGAIGVFRTIDTDTYDILTKLVTNTINLIPGVGGLSYREWRKFENDRIKRDYRGFIDGDVLDLFLNLDLDNKKRVINGEISSDNEEVGGEALNLPLNMVIDMVKEILNFY